MTFFKKIWGLMSKVIQPFFQTAVIVAAIYIIASLYVNKNEVSAKYVEIAANVLSRETTKDDKVLRKWAVDIINKEAPVPMESELKTKLINGEIILGSINVTEGSDTMSGTGTVK